MLYNSQADPTLRSKMEASLQVIKAKGKWNLLAIRDVDLSFPSPLETISIWARWLGEGRGMEYWLGTGEMAEKGPEVTRTAATHKEFDRVMDDYMVGRPAVMIPEV